TGGGGSESVSFLNGNTDALGASAGTGVPRFTAAALHYANSWNGPADHLIANYQFSQFFTQPKTTSESLQTQADSTYGQIQQSKSENRQIQHWVYGIYDWAPNNSTAFKFVFHGSNSEGDNRYGAIGSSTFNDTLVNSSVRNIQDKVSRQNIGGSIAWRTTSRGSKRRFSAGIDFLKIDNATNGYLYSRNQFFESTGALQSTDTVDQRKEISSHLLNLGGSANYVSPLWKGSQLGISYRMLFTQDQPLQATYSQRDGKYQNIVDSLTNSLKTGTLNQYATINLQGKLKHLNYTLGNDLLLFKYKQQDKLADSSVHLSYLNWAPRALINYTPNPATNLNFIYTASSQDPSAAQLQPIKNNNDPLHLFVGNPNLKPGFKQSMQFNFHRFKTWIINLGLNLNMSSNDISTKTVTDSLGRQVSQPVNVNGGRAEEMNFSIGRKLLGIDVNIFANECYSRTVTYVNAEVSRNDAYAGRGGINLNKYIIDKLALQLNTSFTYFDQNSSINRSAPIRYWSQNHQGSLTLFFIPGFEINMNAVYTWQQKTAAFSANTSVLLWNGYVARNFMHDKLVVKFQFNNILDANAGVTRTNAANVNTETSTNILGRYWMLSATWHFDKKFRRK